MSLFFQIVKLISEYSDEKLYGEEIKWMLNKSYSILPFECTNCGRLMELNIKIDISDQDRIIVTENIEKFNQLGFEISLKNKSMTIKAKPLFLNNEDTEELIYSIIENFKLNLTLENPIEDFFCSKLAKKNSIKNGKKLNSIEIKKLINDLHIKSKDLSFYKGDIFSFMLKFEDIKKNIG